MIASSCLPLHCCNVPGTGMETTYSSAAADTAVAWACGDVLTFVRHWAFAFDRARWPKSARVCHVRETRHPQMLEVSVLPIYCRGFIMLELYSSISEAFVINSGKILSRIAAAGDTSGWFARSFCTNSIILRSRHCNVAREKSLWFVCGSR